ncbi:MAG: hypothetical protein HY873_06585 [Chloroflexi bacterium]|nr:hypothetical protein [Chloroflexota bacterium]
MTSYTNAADTHAPAAVPPRTSRGACPEGITVVYPDTPGPNPRLSSHDVRDLIDAAGPLSLRDIAGGLDAPLARVAGLVARMLAQGCLRQDEWGRHRRSPAPAC